MKKTPFLTLEKAQEIIREIPTPFHIYDEAGIRANARALKAGLCLESGLPGVFCREGYAEPLHPPNSEGGGLRL